MSTLHIVYGYCEDRHKTKLYEHLTQNTPVLRVKTIGHIADKAAFAALTYSFPHPNIDDVHWLPHSVPNKKKTGRTHRVERPALSRKKYHQHALANDQIKQCQKVSRAYRKQHNLTLNEKNWRQHINHKAALSAIESLLVPKKYDVTFSLARNQQPTPYSVTH